MQGFEGRRFKGELLERRDAEAAEKCRMKTHLVRGGSFSAVLCVLCDSALRDFPPFSRLACTPSPHHAPPGRPRKYSRERKDKGVPSAGFAPSCGKGMKVYPVQCSTVAAHGDGQETLKLPLTCDDSSTRSLCAFCAILWPNESRLLPLAMDPGEPIFSPASRSRPLPDCRLSLWDRTPCIRAG